MKQRKFSVALILVLLVSMLVMSLTANAAAKPKLNKTKATINVGGTVQLKLNNNKKKVTWSSNKKAVATVSKKGLVKGVKAGTAKVTAKVGKNKYTCTVTVKAGAAGDGALKFTVNSKIWLYGNTEDDDDMTVDLNDYLDVTPASAKVTWKSSKPAVASIDANGVVTAVADGRTKITATANGESAGITVEVTGMGKEAGNRVVLSKRNASKYLQKVEVKTVYLGADGKVLRNKYVYPNDKEDEEEYTGTYGCATNWYYFVNNPSVNMLLSDASFSVKYHYGRYNATIGAEGLVPGSLIKMGSSQKSRSLSEIEFPKDEPFTYYDNASGTKLNGTKKVICSADVAGKKLLAVNYCSADPYSPTYEGGAITSLKMYVPSDEVIVSASGTIYLG